ncbi:MAG: glycosyltransferase [Lachnospiraceae bacterium]
MEKAKISSLMSRLYSEVKRNGVVNTYYKVQERKAKDLIQANYGEERKAELPSEEELLKQSKRNFFPDHLISIVVPTYQTPEVFLRQMIESVLGQTFCHTELCIADGSDDDSVEKIVLEYQAKDPRMKYCRLTENKGIAENTNEGLKMVSGEYVGLLDHDDLLEKNALYEIMMAISKHPEADVIYTDEDKVSADLTQYYEPHRKSDFNRDLLRSNNYICHFLVMKRELLEKVGVFRSAYDGAQDYDLVLRLTENAKKVVHIPKVLYHWRTHEASTAANPMSKLYAYEAGKRAVESHLERCHEKGTVEHTRFYGFYQIKYEVSPQICADIVGLSCRDENRKKILNNFCDEINGQNPGNVIYYVEEFNKFVIFSRELLAELKGDVIVFVHTDLKKISKEGIRQLIANASRPQIGMAGGVVYEDSGKLLSGRKHRNEAGVLQDTDRGLARGFTGNFHAAILQQNTEGVPNEIFAVRRDLFDSWNPKKADTSEELMQDLCAHVLKQGYLISYVPCAGAVLRNDNEND